jgi:predicted transcriptional regulator of viral defense system
MKVSSAELTVLDLLRYPQASGGLDNIATVLDEIAAKLDAEKLARVSSAFERSVVQRAGYLLSQAGLQEHADKIQAYLEAGPTTQWIELEPSLAADSDLVPPAKIRDKRWRVIVRRIPERDQ